MLSITPYVIGDCTYEQDKWLAPYQPYLPFPQEVSGWECPRCKVVYNPSVQSCQCQAGKFTITYTTSGTNASK